MQCLLQVKNIKFAAEKYYTEMEAFVMAIESEVINALNYTEYILRNSLGITDLCRECDFDTPKYNVLCQSVTLKGQWNTVQGTVARQIP
jgi:hypothetical protein